MPDGNLSGMESREELREVLLRRVLLAGTHKQTIPPMPERTANASPYLDAVGIPGSSAAPPVICSIIPPSGDVCTIFLAAATLFALS